MKITQKMVREVKKHARATWHDQKWWDFENKKETTAIQVAIYAAQEGDTPAQVVAAAQKYLDEQNKGG